MKNWKTTTAGLVTAFAGFVLFSPDLFSRWSWVGDVAKYIMAGGLAGIGLFSKDSTTHSTIPEVTKATKVEDEK